MNMCLRTTPAATLLSCALLVACGDSGGPPAPAVNLDVSSGSALAGEAGQPLADSLGVLVLRASDNAPVSGVTVTWSVVAGGGSVSPTQSTSNASGIARALRTLGPTAGVQTTRAVSGTAEVVFQSTARIQGAVSIANRTTGTVTDTTLGTSAQPLVVFVSDENNVPVAGVTVLWSASGGGSVSATSVPTNAAGESSVQYTFGPTAGAQGAQASVTGLVGSPVAITLTGTAGNATTLEKSAGDGTTAAPGSQVVYTVVTKDARGNARGGVTIDWAVSTGGGSVTPAQIVTGTNGTAQATRTLGAAPGAQTTTATAAALAGAPQVTFTTTATAVVRVSNDFFDPSTVAVAVGSNVTWEWQPGAVVHNVTFNAVTGAPAHIGDRSTGSESRTFSTAGSFPYLCTIHGVAMSGSVTVNP